MDGFVEILQQRSAAGTLDQWVTRHPTPNLLTSLIYTGLPFLLLAIGFFVVMRMVNGGGSGSPLSFGKSKAKLASKNMPKTTFADVAGVDEAVEEQRCSTMYDIIIFDPALVSDDDFPN